MTINLNCSLAVRECVGLPHLALGLENLPLFSFRPISSVPHINQQRLGNLHFPRVREFACLYFEFYWVLVVFIFVVSGRCDNFGSGFTTHSQNAFYMPIRSCNWLKVCGKTGSNAKYTWSGHSILFSLNVVFSAPCIVFSLKLRLISFFLLFFSCAQLWTLC